MTRDEFVGLLELFITQVVEYAQQRQNHSESALTELKNRAGDVVLPANASIVDLDLAGSALLGERRLDDVARYLEMPRSKVLSLFEENRVMGETSLPRQVVSEAWARARGKFGRQAKGSVKRPRIDTPEGGTGVPAEEASGPSPSAVPSDRAREEEAAEGNQVAESRATGGEGGPTTQTLPSPAPSAEVKQRPTARYYATTPRQRGSWWISEIRDISSNAQVSRVMDRDPATTQWGGCAAKAEGVA